VFLNTFLTDGQKIVDKVNICDYYAHYRQGEPP